MQKNARNPVKYFIFSDFDENYAKKFGQACKIGQSEHLSAKCRFCPSFLNLLLKIESVPETFSKRFLYEF